MQPSVFNKQTSMPWNPPTQSPDGSYCPGNGCRAAILGFSVPFQSSDDCGITTMQAVAGVRRGAGGLFGGR
jgi:hypothetical protein